MKAARQFAAGLLQQQLPVARISITLYGSLAYTGKGHGTDSAILLGLLGCEPETLDPDTVDDQLRQVHVRQEIVIPGIGMLAFDPERDLLFEMKQELPRHTNGMRFVAQNKGGATIFSEDYYSLGGGFVARGDEAEVASQEGERLYPFTSGGELLQMSESNSMSIAELVEKNELHWRSKAEVEKRISDVWLAMQNCVTRGLATEGVLPGRLSVLRRAAKLHRKLLAREETTAMDAMDWVNVFAIAVNEENAAGGKVVTSPTNGAAGIIPAVIHYYMKFERNADEEGIKRFILVAGAIGILYKINASISGAEMGCQGEVGVACSMAAAGLVAANGGSNSQIENAAEIGMEHNLGLTCDPVGGLVQIPCIERNAMGAIKAINAARLAMQGDGTHKVSLDQVIKTMRQTGLDMSTIYKETSEGGLAVNVPEC
jgi:L-serine dehydratase